MQLAEIASTDVVLLVLAVGLLVFGSAKLPKIARGLGSARTEFERGLKEGRVESTPVVEVSPTDPHGS